MIPYVGFNIFYIEYRDNSINGSLTRIRKKNAMIFEKIPFFGARTFKNGSNDMVYYDVIQLIFERLWNVSY